MWANSTYQGHIRMLAHAFIDAPHVDILESRPKGGEFRYHCKTCGNYKSTEVVIIYNFLTSYDHYYSINMCEACDIAVQKKVAKWSERLPNEQKMILDYKRAMEKVIRRLKLMA